MKKKLMIEGMHCENCAKAVKTALTEDIKGIKVIKVNIKHKYAEVDMDDDVNEEEIRKVIEDCGFKLTDIVEVKGLFGRK